MAGPLDTLDDLALLIARAEKSAKGRTFDELVANEDAFDALTYRLAMIGETSKKLPAFRNEYATGMHAEGIGRRKSDNPKSDAHSGLSPRGFHVTTR